MVSNWRRNKKMSSVERLKPPSQTATSIEPVKEKRLELGKKVFKVPTQSKRRSSRIQRPEAKCQKEKRPTEIVHHLLLAPTLKRQRKKKLEREKTTLKQTAKATREWKWDFITKSEEEIKLSEIFITKKPGHFSKKRPPFKIIAPGILKHTYVRGEGKKRKTIDLVKIRHLGRCGGVKCVPGLNTFNGDGSENRTFVPPPFEARNGDPYITPKPGQLISYIWHSRPSPLFDRKQIYRTGILVSNDGTMRFFESDDENAAKKDEDRKFYEDRFYLNKQVFKNGNFRVRTDLVVGAICYEREMKFLCKIMKIDEKSGAVLVENLKAQDRNIIHTWISPDDLIGNCEVSKVLDDRKKRILNNSINFSPNNIRSHQSRNTGATEQIRHIGQHFATSRPEIIDLTQEDEYDSHLVPLKPLTSPQNTNGFHFRSNSECRFKSRGQSFPANSSSVQPSLEILTSRYTSTDPSCQTLDVTSNFSPDTKTQMTSDNERSTTSTVADVCKSLSSVSGVPNSDHSRGGDFENRKYCDREFISSVQIQPSSFERTQSVFHRFADESLRTRDNFNSTSSVAASARLDASLTAQILSDRFAIRGSSSSSLLPSGVTMQSELDLLKQHGMALEILMSAADLGTIVASLQFIKRVHQRGIPVGPTAAKLVSAAEMTSRNIIEDKFLRHLTAPICSGGKGYNMSHAGIILCRLAPILGPSLGRLDSPTVDSRKLLSLGLNRDEVFDILPYIQSFEDDILMKTLSFNRQLPNVH